MKAFQKIVAKAKEALGGKKLLGADIHGNKYYVHTEGKLLYNLIFYTTINTPFVTKAVLNVELSITQMAYQTQISPYQ